MPNQNMMPLVFIASVLMACNAVAQDADDCESLHNTSLSSGFISSALVIPATDTQASYCQVQAIALPAISIEVRLPMEDWNGKYYQAGCGGFCGILGRADAGKGWVNAMRPGLERGYATATSDSGHHALSVVDAGWAAANPHAERDWGWRSIGETHRIAQVLIDAFYSSDADQAIFQGCSTGGRMAHMAALRYPEMFDGIISGAPALDYPGLVGTSMSWLMQANTDADGEWILKPGKDTLIGDTVMATCDGVDGKDDGLIDDPRNCDTDLSALQCEGASADTCLTEAELGVVAKWRQGPVNSAGESLYPGGIPAGSESFWWLWLTGNDKGAGRLVNAFAQGFGAYMAFDDDPGASWTPQDFDFDKDPARMANAASAYNSDNPDISAFRAAGGKMIVWHGWSDAIVPPFKTLDWYEQASELAGGEDSLKENVALFMVPGLDHCGILPSPSGINQAGLDPMGPLESWLNDGTRPNSILAAE